MASIPIKSVAAIVLSAMLNTVGYCSVSKGRDNHHWKGYAVQF